MQYCVTSVTSRIPEIISATRDVIRFQWNLLTQAVQAGVDVDGIAAAGRLRVPDQTGTAGHAQAVRASATVLVVATRVAHLVVPLLQSATVVHTVGSRPYAVQDH